MLGLTLREEFRGRRLKGTAIELSNDTNTGATQVAAQEFLEITYPTHDLLKAIEAVGPNQGRPVVVMGERGLGKSHLMGALHHAVSDSASTAAWQDAILSFQNHFEGGAALFFWLPSDHGRIKVHTATDAVSWRCAAPHGESHIDFGRILWGEAREYPQEILLREGGRPVGLFHLRIT